MTFRGRPARGVRTAATLNGQGPCHARVTHARGTGEVGHRGPEGATAGVRVAAAPRRRGILANTRPRSRGATSGSISCNNEHHFVPHEQPGSARPTRPSGPVPPSPATGILRCIGDCHDHGKAEARQERRYISDRGHLGSLVLSSPPRALSLIRSPQPGYPTRRHDSPPAQRGSRSRSGLASRSR